MRYQGGRVRDRYRKDGIMMKNSPTVSSIRFVKALSALLFVILIGSMIGCGSDDGAPPASSAGAGSSSGDVPDRDGDPGNTMADSKHADQFKAYAKSFVIINDPPGVTHITTGENTVSFGGISNEMVQLSYTNQTGKQPTPQLSPVDPEPVWRVEGLPLETGDNIITVHGQGTDKKSRSDKLTITHNPGFPFEPVEVSPRELDHKSTDTVSVSVKVHNPAILAGDIGIFALDSQGRLAGKALATLNDKAENGDAVAADGVYSGKVAIDTHTAKTYPLRLGFPVKPSGKDPYTAKSEIILVTVLDAFTDQDGKELKASVNQVVSKYPGFIEAGESKREAFSKVASELKKHETVMDAVVADNGQAVWWTMNSGVTLAYTDYPEDTIGGKPAFNPEQDALVWAPYVSGPGKIRRESAHVKAIKGIFEQFRCPRLNFVDTLVDDEARVMRMNHKDILYISSHGGVVPGDPAQSGELLPGESLIGMVGFKSPAAGTVYFWSKSKFTYGDLRNLNVSPALRAEYRAGRIVVLVPRKYAESGEFYDDDQLYWGITSKFIEHHFERFPSNSVVHVRTCSSAKNMTMAHAFLKKGVRVYTGFTDITGSDYGNAVSETYFDRIRQGDTVSESVQYARSEHGPNDPKVENLLGIKSRLVALTGKDAAPCAGDCAAELNLSWSLDTGSKADVAASKEAANVFMKMDHKRDESGTANVIFKEVLKDPEFPNLGKKLLPKGAFSFTATEEFKGTSGFKGFLEESKETLLTGEGDDAWNWENNSQDDYGYISLKVYWPEEEVNLDNAIKEAQQNIDDAPPEVVSKLPPELLKAMGQMTELKQQMKNLESLTSEIKASRPKPKKGQIAYNLKLSVRGLPAREVENGKAKKGSIGSETPIDIYRVVDAKSGSYPISEKGEYKNGTYKISGTLVIDRNLRERTLDSE